MNGDVDFLNFLSIFIKCSILELSSCPFYLVEFNIPVQYPCFLRLSATVEYITYPVDSGIHAPFVRPASAYADFCLIISVLNFTTLSCTYILCDLFLVDENEWMGKKCS